MLEVLEPRKHPVSNMSRLVGPSKTDTLPIDP